MLKRLAGATGLEPATFGVTGRTNSHGINAGCDFFTRQTTPETGKSCNYSRPALLVQVGRRR
jgi:hypothetical protein